MGGDSESVSGETPGEDFGSIASKRGASDGQNPEAGDMQSVSKAKED
jgi:hypothetical protein